LNYEKYKSVFLVAIVFAFIGYIETRPAIILFLNQLNPLCILLLWYGVIFAPLLYLFGKAHWKDKFNHRHVVSILMLFFAFSIIAYFPASNYVNQVTNTNSSAILIASEDGIVYQIVSQYVTNLELAAIITYVITPLFLVFGAGIVMKPKEFKKTLEQIF